jgi:hypothetical protein
MSHAALVRCCARAASGRRFSLPARRRLYVRASGRRWECPRRFRCSALRIDAAGHDALCVVFRPFCRHDQVPSEIRERRKLSRLAVSRHARCASAETTPAHRESMARAAVPNSSCPSRDRHAQRFHQLQNPYRAILARSPRPCASP